MAKDSVLPDPIFQHGIFTKNEPDTQIFSANDQFSTKIQADFDQNKIMGKLNPTGFPGLHYLCGACEYSSIPDKSAGLLKRRTTDGTDPDRESTDSIQAPEANQQESITEGGNRTEVDNDTTNNQPNQPYLLSCWRCVIEW